MAHSTPDTRPFGARGTRIYDGFGYLGGLFLAIMVLAVFGQVLIRRFFMFSIDGIEEVPRFLFVWLVMLGGASAMQRGEHTLLEYFRDKLSPRWNAFVRMLMDGLGVFLFLYIIRVSFILLPQSHPMQSPGLGLRYSYIYAAMPFGAALMVFPMGWRMIVAAREFWRTWQKPS